MTHQKFAEARPYVQFICHPHECLWSTSINSRVTYDIMEKDVSREDMLEQFQYFMSAMGYHFDTNETITIVSENDL